MKRTLVLSSLAALAAVTIAATVSPVRAQTANPPAFTLTRIMTDSTGLGAPGLVHRVRCELTDSQLTVVKIIDGNPIARRTPVQFSDPLIPGALNSIPTLARTATGVAPPAFPQGIPTANYWVTTPGEGQRLLRSTQGGAVSAEDPSAAAQTLVRILDATCF